MLKILEVFYTLFRTPRLHSGHLNTRFNEMLFRPPRKTVTIGLVSYFTTAYENSTGTLFSSGRQRIFYASVQNQKQRVRRKHTNPGSSDRNNGSSIRRTSTLYYVIAVGVLAVGLSYASVPLYRIFCQAYSYGGTTQTDDKGTGKIVVMKKRKDREILIRFNADTAASMQWNFRPEQPVVKVIPGETALAFYSARNPTSKPVIGISTYNVVPFDAGQYFNKIQCFCFEEQMLNPEEEVSMPVFFYIDPEFADDPKMEYVNEIMLSYTFFEAKEGLRLPLPGFLSKS